ncbi:cytochrome P450 [Scleroderma citrinum]
MLISPSLELFLLFSIVLLTIITVPILSRSLKVSLFPPLLNPCLRVIKLRAIPTLGSTTWVGSYSSAIKNFGGISEIVQEGYDKYKGIPFKIPTLSNWMVIVSGNKLIEEVKRAPEEHLSAVEAINDAFQIAFTIGEEVARNPYHFAIIKTSLTRQLTGLFPSIDDEITLTLSEVFGSEDNEWENVVAFDAIRKVVSRASNRVFVGLSLCRNPGWLELSSRVASDVIVSATTMNLFPRFILVAKFVTSTSRNTRQGNEYLGPVIRERQKRRATRLQDGNQADTPNDFLQWLIDNDTETSEWEITQRILVMVFASIHTTATSFVPVLYNLAAHPEYLKPLREEVDSIVHQDGWTKIAIDKMHMVDSFLKENHRLNCISSLVGVRRVRKDFTFSDGRVVPRGCDIAIPLSAIHHDEEIYSSSNTFDPFRFSRLHIDQNDPRQQLVSLNSDFLTFGHGKYAWYGHDHLLLAAAYLEHTSSPGRFFSTTLQKTLLARIVTLYDLKLEDNAPSTMKTIELGVFVAPDPTTRVFMRRRML